MPGPETSVTSGATAANSAGIVASVGANVASSPTRPARPPVRRLPRSSLHSASAPASARVRGRTCFDARAERRAREQDGVCAAGRGVAGEVRKRVGHRGRQLAFPCKVGRQRIVQQSWRAAPPARAWRTMLRWRDGVLQRVDQRECASTSPMCRGRMLGGGVDHLAHLGDLGRRKAADLCMFADDVLIFGKIDAERLVGGNEALHPLDIGTELVQHGVGFGSRAAQLFALQRPAAGMSRSMMNLRRAMVSSGSTWVAHRATTPRGRQASALCQRRWLRS